MNLESITKFSLIKGLNLVGTGDFTHPSWFKEIKEKLVEVDESNLYTLKGAENSILFMLTAEVCTIFHFEDSVKKIHHVIWSPSFEVVEQVNEALSKYGSLAIDGRPNLQMTASELVETVLGISERNVIFPAHAWTPWFSLFGAFSGFNRLKDCYQDEASKIFALETGLSSDPPMNWRVSELDRIAIISNSDSHSHWPWRLGREANVLQLEKFSFDNVIDALKANDPKRFLFTIETNPAYGKYHWTGHRACEISMPAIDAFKNGDICPKCGRRMTKGVEQRVEEVADRPEGYKPLSRTGFIHLLPLSEIIAFAMGIDNPSNKNVWNIYNILIQKFGNEYNVLLDASFDDVTKIVSREIADLIVRVREDRIKITPGFDGVYGKLLKNDSPKINKLKRTVSLHDFMGA